MGSPGFAGDLQDELKVQLDKGTLEFSPLEAAFIAEGIADRAALDTYVEKFNNLLSQLALDEKQARGNGKKKAKALHKNLFAHLKLEGEPGDGLVNALDDSAHTPLSATFLLASLAESAGLSGSDWSSLKDKLDPFFLDSNAQAVEVLAAHLVWKAFHEEENQQLAMLMLLTSKQIHPESTFTPNELDKHFYNRCLKFFNEGTLLDASHLIIGSGNRFASQELYNPIAYNTGVKLVNNGLEDVSLAMSLARDLFPLMGQYGKDFEVVLDNRQYNLAANLYNEKKFEQAMVELERVKNPPNAANFQKVLSSTYAIVAEQRILDGKTAEGEAVMAKLKELDGERATQLEQRLAQLRLKDMVDSGDLEKALAAAAGNLDTEVDRENYRSVLIQFNQGLRAGKSFEKALAILENLPEKAQLGDTPMNLRFNTYSDWLETFEDDDFQGLLPLYQRIYSDKALKMTPSNDEILRENYGNAMHQEIVKLIEDRHFQKADQRSKEALKIAPNHKALLEQRKLVDTIMRRIAED